MLDREIYSVGEEKHSTSLHNGSSTRAGLLQNENLKQGGCRGMRDVAPVLRCQVTVLFGERKGASHPTDAACPGNWVDRD